MKTKFAYYIDVAFTFFVCFMLALVLFNFFTPYPYSIIFSLCLAFLLGVLYLAISDNRRKKQALSREEQKQTDELMLELNFSTRQEQNAHIESGLNKAGVTFERKQGAILVKNSNALLISKFSFNKVGKSDIVRAFNLITKEQTAYILAQSFESDVVAFAERFNGKVVLVSGNKVYAYLKKYGALPQTYKYKCFSERKKKGSLKNLLDKKKAKTFLLFGTFFLLFSYISPLKLYYIVCGSAFLLYALVLRLFGKELKITAQTADNI